MSHGYLVMLSSDVDLWVVLWIRPLGYGIGEAEKVRGTADGRSFSDPEIVLVFLVKHF